MAAKKKKGKKRRVPRGAQLVCTSGYDLGTRSPKTGKKFKGGPMCVTKKAGSFRTKFPRVIREKKRTKRGLGPNVASPIIPQRSISVRGLRGHNGTGCGCGS